MNHFLCYLVSAFTLLALSSSGSEPRYGFSVFEDSFEDSLEHAKEADQSLFVYFYVQDCAACEYMDYQFHRSSVWEYLNIRFVNVQINASSEESNDPDIAKRFNVASYPTYLILDHDGKVMHRATGAMKGEVFNRTISWLTGEVAYPMAKLDAKYEAGERDPTFVQQYLLDARIVLPKNLDIRDLHLKAWGIAHDKYRSIAKEYLASREPEDLINLRDFLIIKAYSNTMDDPGIKLVLDYFDAFVETISMEQVSTTVLKVAFNTVLINAMVVETWPNVDDTELLKQASLKKATDWLRNVDEETLLFRKEYDLKNLREILTNSEGSNPDLAE